MSKKVTQPRRKKSEPKVSRTRAGTPHGDIPQQPVFESQASRMPNPNFDEETGHFIGPLNMSMAERRHVYPAEFPTTKRKKKAKKKTRSKRRSMAGGYAVYHPTGDIAGVVGRGGYFSDAINAIGRTARGLVPKGAFQQLGGTAGSALGNYFGHAGIGNQLGRLAGSEIAKIAGFGAYNVKANSIMAKVDEGVQIPQFNNTQYATVIKHREYIQDITAVGATAFTNISFPVNPGIALTFPWLAGVASNYDQYQILGMIFEFRTLSSDITSGGALGSVILSSDYDTVDSSYVNKLEMENAEYCTSNKPSVDTVHCIECDPSVTFCPLKYVRSTAVPLGKDPRLYDHCNFQVATVGLPSSGQTVIGELWVSYEIAFYKPNLVNSIEFTSGGRADHFDLTTQIASVSGTANYFGATGVQYNPSATSTLNGYIDNSTYYFPLGTQGRFLFMYSALGGQTTLTTQMASSVSNCTKFTLFNTGATSQRADAAGTTLENWLSYELCVTISAIQAATGIASITLTAGTLPGSLSSGDVLVITVPATLA